MGIVPRSALVWAAVTVLAALASGIFGFVINDEQDQAVALYNLAHGSLLTVNHPAQFYAVNGIPVNPRFPGVAPVGSTLLDVIAIPFVLLVRIANWFMPITVWMSALASGLLVYLLNGRLSARRKFWVGLALTIAFAWGMRGHDPLLPAFETAVALQALNLAILGALALAVYGIISRRISNDGRSILGIAVLAGPLVFWGSRMKYTVLAALLVATSLWLAGQQQSRSRNLALGLMAALAVWNNVGEGAVVAVAIALFVFLELFDSANSPGQRIKGFFCAVTGAVFGIIPWVYENWSISGNPLAASYLYLRENNAGTTIGRETTSSTLHRIVSNAFGLEFWKGPMDFLGNLQSPWFLGERVEALPIGVFVLSPVLLGSLWAFRRFTWWHDRGARLAVGMVLVNAVLLTNRIVRQGWGLDSRLLAPLIPAVGLLAAAGLAEPLSRITNPQSKSARQWCILFSIIGTSLLILLAATHGLRLGWRVWSQVRPALLLWTALAAFVAALAVFIAPLLEFPERMRYGMFYGAWLSIPVVWLVVASVVAAPSVPAGEHSGAFLPAIQELRVAVKPWLLPPAPVPLVLVNNQTVFDPSYGYCNTDPSPCPWGNPHV